jgi:hypothetical protein
MEKFCRAGQAIGGNVAQTRAGYQGYKYTLRLRNTFPLQQWLHEHSSLLTLHLHYLSCFPIVYVLLKTQKSLSSCKTQDLWYPKCWFHWLGVICTHPLEKG